MYSWFPQMGISTFNGQKLKLKLSLTCLKVFLAGSSFLSTEPPCRGFLCSPVDLLKKLIEILLYLQQVPGGPDPLSGQGTSRSLTKLQFPNPARVIPAPSLLSRKVRRFPLPLNEVCSLQRIQVFPAVVCDFPCVLALFQFPGFR